MHKPVNIEEIRGRRFGRLVVTDLHTVKHDYKKFFYCKCDCGKENVSVLLSALTSRNTQSCGCLHTDTIIDICGTHLLTKHPLFKVHNGIKYRCYKPHCREYKYYGGRGIAVCDEWLNSFITFYIWAIEAGWKKGLQIDRIQTNGNYEPSNCRFITQTENVRNRRTTLMIEFRGEIKSLGEWAEIVGISYGTAWQRVVNLKMPLERAFQSKRLNRMIA